MANGDIALTTPKSIPNVVFGDVAVFQLPSPFVTVTFYENDATGPSHTVRITNSATNVSGAVTGFDYAAGVFTDGVARAPGNNYLTAILGVLFIGNATTLNQRKTALVSRLIADGVITAAGTVA